MNKILLFQVEQKVFGLDLLIVKNIERASYLDSQDFRDSQDYKALIILNLGEIFFNISDKNNYKVSILTEVNGKNFALVVDKIEKIIDLSNLPNSKTCEMPRALGNSVLWFTNALQYNELIVPLLNHNELETISRANELLAMELEDSIDNFVDKDEIIELLETVDDFVYNISFTDIDLNNTNIENNIESALISFLEKKEISDIIEQKISKVLEKLVYEKLSKIKNQLINK